MLSSRLLFQVAREPPAADPDRDESFLMLALLDLGDILLDSGSCALRCSGAEVLYNRQMLAAMVRCAMCAQQLQRERDHALTPIGFRLSER